MIDQFYVVLQQPWLLAIVIPAIGIVIYMVYLIGKQFLRLFTEKSKIKK